MLAMSTVRKTRSGGQYLVYVPLSVNISTPCREARALEGVNPVNKGRNTTDGRAYNHHTCCLTS